MTAELWIPQSARQKTARCFICGETFPMPAYKRSWMQHVVKCDKRNSDVTDGLYEAHEASAYTSVQDKEQFNYVRERAKERN